MKILAFLQNPWWKAGTDPRHIEMYRENARFRSIVLTHSATGRALRRAFGDELYDAIAWDNASYEYSETRGHVARPDFMYMARRVAAVRPDVVLLFGGQAQSGWELIQEQNNLSGLTVRPVVLRAPHPMARGSQVDHLKKISAEVKRLVSLETSRA